MIFFCFDQLVDKYGFEKIKIIGDVYMVVGGFFILRKDYVEAIVEMVLDMLY